MSKQISGKLIKTSLLLVVLLLAACGGGATLSDSAENDGESGSFSDAANDADDSNSSDLESAVATDLPEPTDEPAPEPLDVPDSFTITLSFDDEPVCGYYGFEFDYDVTLTTDTISLYQIAADITSTGPYDPFTGEFTAEIGGLPGTEVYDGTISLVGTTVLMDGEYTYVDDPGQSCEGLWPFAGSYTP